MRRIFLFYLFHKIIIYYFFLYFSYLHCRFLIFTLLIPHIHREGGVGQQARDAMLLCMSLSRKNDEVGSYIADPSTGVCSVNFLSFFFLKIIFFEYLNIIKYFIDKNILQKIFCFNFLHQGIGNGYKCPLFRFAEKIGYRNR